MLYIDTDAHHGDGVQWTFYNRKDIVTYSIHETGRYLFPGTGSATERGTEDGFGFAVNLPIDAFTEDESFLDVFKTSAEKVIQTFKPDVILSQNGVDAHYRDPMTHLSLTSKLMKKFRDLSAAWPINTQTAAGLLSVEAVIIFGRSFRACGAKYGSP